MMTTTELKKTIADIQKSGNEFCYMMLSRMQNDCLYYLGYGNKNNKHLWAKNEYDQIELMRMLYDILPEKPEWLAKEQIEEYANEMLPNNWYGNFSAFEWQEDDSFICKASEEALKSPDTQNLVIALLWEWSLDFAVAGEDGCMGNYDMYTPLYNYSNDKLYLVSHSEAEKWKEGEIIRIYGRETDKEERREIEEFMNK